MAGGAVSEPKANEMATQWWRAWKVPTAIIPPPGFQQPIPDPSFRVLAGQDIADLIGKR